MSSLIQGADEWHKLRRTKIGASDAPVIMEVSPWNTPYQLWELKMGFRKNETSNAMKRGLEMEEEARRAFEIKTGLLVVPTVFFHIEFDWMMASLDGCDLEEDNIVEIKCPGKIDHEKAMNGQVPEKYYPQLQHQIEVAGVDFSYYFSYTPDSSNVITVPRDQKYIDNLLIKEKEFYRCMYEKEQPELIERDFTERDDHEWITYAPLYMNAKKESDKWKKEEDFFRQKLIDLADKKNCAGGGIKLGKHTRKGSVDYCGIPELIGVDLEKHRKNPTTVWRIGEQKNV